MGMHAVKPSCLNTARDINGSEVRQIATLAKKHNVWILWSLAERRSSKVANTAILLAPNGKPELFYRKIHLCREASEHCSYVPGKRFTTVSIKGFKVGVMICFDRHFPEAARTLCLLGADLIPHPTATNWFSRNPKSINTAMIRTRAYENRCFILSVNRADYKGGSALFGPYGKILAVAGNKEEIMFCEVDIKRIRKKPDGCFDLLSARKPKAYRLVSKWH